MATMTFERTPRGYFTVMGVSVERAVAGLDAAGADVVGSNCGTGIEDMIEVARAMARATALPLAHPAERRPAGEPRRAARLQPDRPRRMAARVPELLELGVAIVGGCCGTTPDHTRAIRKAVETAR